MMLPTVDEDIAHARNESWRGEPVVLADGSSLEIGSWSHDRLVELQWEQERDFARRILSSDKGSADRAAAVAAEPATGAEFSEAGDPLTAGASGPMTTTGGLTRGVSPPPSARRNCCGACRKKLKRPLIWRALRWCAHICSGSAR